MDSGTKQKKQKLQVENNNMSGLLDRPLITRKSSGHQSVPVEPFHPDAKTFLQQQHTLPKMPLPALVTLDKTLYIFDDSF